MVEFIKSKQTTFVNKPVGIVQADTGATSLGNAIADFGKTLQTIAFTEAKNDAIKTDIETAKTLPIIDDNGNFKFEKGNFSKVGEAKARSVLEARYANKLMNLAKEKFNTLHQAYQYDKDGFDDAAKDYIKGHVDSFKKNGMETFIPSFLSKIEQQAVYHSNKIFNDVADEEERIAMEDIKINIEDEVRTLEALNYNLRNITSYEDAEDAKDLEEDIKETNNYIESAITQLKGKKHGLKAPAINEIRRKMKIYSASGILNQIIDKNPNDDKAIKIMENVIQTGKITPVQEAYLRISNNKINMQDMQYLAGLNKQFGFSYSDRDYITRYLSNRAGDAAKENLNLAEMIESAEFQNQARGFGVHIDSENNRKGLNKGISMEIGEELNINSLLTMPKGKYEQAIGYLKRSTILPSTLENLFTNTRPLAIFGNMSAESKKVAASRIYDLWNQIGYDAKGNGRYPNKYKATYERFNDIKDIVDIVGADGIVDAFEIATALPQTIKDMNQAISSYSSEFGLDENSDAKDIIESILKSSDIPAEFYGDYKEYVRYKLYKGTISTANGTVVRLDKDKFISSLNNTFRNTMEIDDGVVFSLYGNRLGEHNAHSYVNKYKDDNSRKFFLRHVQNRLDVENNYVENEAGDLVANKRQLNIGENVALIPDSRNKGASRMSFIVADSITKQPIMSQYGTYITIDTADVDFEMSMMADETKKRILEKNYHSVTITEPQIKDIINVLDNTNPPPSMVKGFGEQYYGVNPTLDKALEDAGYNPMNDLINDQKFVSENIPARESPIAKGISYLLDLIGVDTNVTLNNQELPELQNTGTTNPAWKFIYDEVIRDPSLKKATKNQLEKVFDESDSINVQDDFVRNVKYVAGHEGYDGTAYVDGTGKNATISLGAGLNVKFVTDAQMAMISSKGQQAIKEIRQLMKTDMSLERIAEAIDEKYGTIIKKTESDAIFTTKMTENYKQFVKDFPNFALVSVEKQMAMLDHAYQMGYGEGEFVEYWRNITKALNTTNPEHRAFYFQRAGSHLIYNYEKDDQNIFDGNFVTGRTILSRQTEDRVFDRAELFGFHADARTPFFKRKAKQLYNAVRK